jgi:hypothetical protein
MRIRSFKDWLLVDPISVKHLRGVTVLARFKGSLKLALQVWSTNYFLLNI